MKLKQLSLVHCGGFEQLDINFESDITLIAGVNGIGKSTVLRVLATVLSRAMPEFTPSRAGALSFTDDNIHGSKSSLEVSARVEVDSQVINAGIQRIRNAEKGDDFVLLHHAQSKVESSSFNDVLRARTLTGDVEAGMSETRKILGSLKKTINPPLAVYFTPKRQLPGQPRTLQEIKPFSQSAAYVRALDDRDVELREFMHWFRTQESLVEDSTTHQGAMTSLKEQLPPFLRRQKVLDALKSVVTDLVPEFTNLRIQEKPRLGFMVDKRGQPFYLHQLSDGERGLLALVFDLARRLAIANPESDDPIAEGIALVLIDELELHLHPKWQRDILGRLSDIFKNCQFVVTTHSPLVLGEAEARCVRFLRFNDDKVIATTPAEAYGMDANRILQELMGAPVRNTHVERDLELIFGLIDEDKFDEAKSKICELEQSLGENEPELTRASSLIAFLEGDE